MVVRQRIGAVGSRNRPEGHLIRKYDGIRRTV
nr:MAG TPA: hypothetical protein [Caudoviricetes sp.]DAY55092.1 MAG TPA: hypothetical protein [Caudoviricetes sp.]